MNEKFYSLPKEKQQRIIQAGYRVFGGGSYKKCPVGEIAREAGISKSLLFYYFKNKKELYWFLWDEAIRTVEESMQEAGMEKWAQRGYFELLKEGMRYKIKLLAEKPELSQFMINGFYEADVDIADEVQRRCKLLLLKYNQPFLQAMEQEPFVTGLDLHMLVQENYWACDGCFHALMQNGSLDAEEAWATFEGLITFWKSIYLRQE